jgi:DNA-binding NarL/FixJ family response regulator
MRLTQREREIFDLLVAGRSNDDIASQLFIARRTVETHRQHIMKKVGARSLVELIRIATKHGVATTCAI